MKRKYYALTAAVVVAFALAGRGFASSDSPPSTEKLDISQHPYQSTSEWKVANNYSQILNTLVSSGYNRIEFDITVPSIKTVEACRWEKLLRLDVNSNGKVRNIRPIGTCSTSQANTISTFPLPVWAASTKETQSASLKLKKLRNKLVQLGYDRINTFDDRSAINVATACRSGRLMRFAITDTGKLARTSRIGTCSPSKVNTVSTFPMPVWTASTKAKQKASLKLKKLRNKLMLLGYDHINIFDDRASINAATACRSGRLMRFAITDTGKLVRISRIGTCSSFASLRAPAHAETDLTVLPRLSLAGLSQYRNEPVVLPKPAAAKVAPLKTANGLQTASTMYDARIALPAAPIDKQAAANECDGKFAALLKSNPIEFYVSSANITFESRRTLNGLALIGDLCPNAHIIVGGRANSASSHEHNKRLGQHRAEAVMAYLARIGMNTERLSAIGYGKIYPVAPSGKAASKSNIQYIKLVTAWSY